MSELERVELGRAVKGRARKLAFHWKGLEVSLACEYFAVWVGGELLKAPVLGVGRGQRGWTAWGELKTDSGTWTVRDQLTGRGNTLVIDRTWRYRGGRLGSVRLGLDLHVPFGRLDYWAIPYISMNGNGGSKTVPAGLSRDGQPWVFREERTTAPGLMTVESGGLVAGSYAEPGRTERMQSACCILPGKTGYILRTFVPFREAPLSFLGAAFPGNSRLPAQGLYTTPSGFNGFVVEGGAKTFRFRRRFFVVLDRADGRRHGYARVWESAWRNLGEPIAPPVPIGPMEKRLWKSIGFHWLQRGQACGYSIRTSRDGDARDNLSPVLEVAWCGPTMMLAYLAIRRAIREEDPRLADRPVRAAEFYVARAGQPSGTFQTRFDLRTLAWTSRDLNAVQMGGAAYWLLRSVELLRDPLASSPTPGAVRSACLAKTQAGSRKRRPIWFTALADRWAEFALRFCDLAVRTQLPSGALASRWTLDGRPLGTERAMGVHAARAVLQAHRLTGREEYLRSAERAAAFYIRSVIDRESGYGDCTDILNTTTENDAASVADFLIDLYRATGKERYLAKAVRSAEYCLSFLFAYNVWFGPETDCGRRGMRTRGCAAISPETGFVCPFFALQANAFLDLWAETADPRWKDYAVAIVRGSLQMLTEPGDTFGLAGRLIDCRGEVIAVTDTVKGPFVWKKGMTEYAMHEPVWWPAAFNLLNFALIEDRFPQVRKEIER